MMIFVVVVIVVIKSESLVMLVCSSDSTELQVVESTKGACEILISEDEIQL